MGALRLPTKLEGRLLEHLAALGGHGSPYGRVRNVGRKVVEACVEAGWLAWEDADRHICGLTALGWRVVRGDAPNTAPT